MGLLVVSGSPHVHGNLNVKKIMWSVIIALLPALFVAVWFFGIHALLVTMTAIISCMLFEFLIQKYILKSDEFTLSDGSAIITGILLAFNVPSSLPLWEVVVGSLVSIGVAKMAFGGLGKNPFNPAIVGRIFMLISFPVDMTTWPLPKPMHPFLSDAVTGATSLGILKEGLMKGESVSHLMNNIPSYQELFVGSVGGSLGEISALALLLGGLFLLFRKVISWHIPVSFMGTVFVMTGVLWLINPERYADPVFHLLAGGLVLGAVFMATDMVTSPMTYKGMLLFGFGCGLLTTLIRIWGAYPEGVSFAILLMNAVTPLINKAFKPKSFGEVINNG